MENKNTSRRTFIKNTGKAGIALGLASTAIPSLAEPFIDKGFQPAPFAQQTLPYSYKDLEAAIDAMTMEIHYTKHAAGYTKNLNDAVAAEIKNTQKLSLENILSKISSYSPKMRNNAGGHYNHEFFWQSMCPHSAGKPEGSLANAIEKDFGSFDTFKTQFADAGKNRFGSGWAWLVMTPDKKLVIGSSPNQDNPLMDISELKGLPLLGLDVWEHAYYLRYQNKRPDYIASWWNVVNWNTVKKRYETVG